MKTITLSGSIRKTIGKKDANALRREKKIPCVLYNEKNQLHFAASEKDFKDIVYSPDVHLIKLDIEGKQTEVIMKDIQFHPVHDNILHVDFMEVFPDKPITIDIPIKIEGTSVGVKEGGKFLKKLKKIRVKGIISKIPETININIENLKIGDYIRIKDLNYEGITFMHEQNASIVAVKKARVVVEETTVAATTAVAPAAGVAATSATSTLGGATATPTPAPASDKEKKKEKKKK
ncbi:MAG: 50S ribosomal protein L25/general stress protein Ctc [Bacteroidota bacterium]